MSDERHDSRDPSAELAGRFLREVAAETDPGTLPTAGQLFWRAAILRRLAERDARAARAERPALWGLALAPLAVVLGLVVTFAGAAGIDLPSDAAPVWLVLAPPLLLVPAALLALWITLRRET